jgi:hypothetical protein
MVTRWNRVVSAGVAGLCAAALLAAPGCASRRQVAMPGGWETQSQQQSQAGSASRSYQPPPPVQAPAPQAGVSTGPILTPPPEIREHNLPPGPEPGPGNQASKEAATPQHMASMHFVDQARHSLAQGKPDAAIPPLEQAIQVDVNNGEAFLLLARAWRQKGARNKALEFARLPLCEELVRCGGLEKGYDHLSALLDLPEPPSAIFAANDINAIYGYKAVTDHGLSVPDDISIIGFDDIELGKMISPPLSTIRVYKEQMGSIAVRTLFKVLNHEIVQPVTTLVPTRLIERESVAARVSA